MKNLPVKRSTRCSSWIFELHLLSASSRWHIYNIPFDYDTINSTGDHCLVACFRWLVVECNGIIILHARGLIRVKNHLKVSSELFLTTMIGPRLKHISYQFLSNSLNHNTENLQINFIFVVHYKEFENWEHLTINVCKILT